MFTHGLSLFLMKTKAWVLILFSLITKTALASHVGCVTINDRALCETEESYTYSSESVSWDMSKEQFRKKLLSYIEYLVPGSVPRVGSVFLWVNDFNRQSALRIQVWTEENNFIVDMPCDLSTIDAATDISVRGAGVLPYPIDFGYTLGELLVTCQGECSDVHTNWLAVMGVAKTEVLLPNMLQLFVPAFSEVKLLEKLKTKSDFNQIFSAIELSPVLEGNGFRSQAFSIYF